MKLVSLPNRGKQALQKNRRKNQWLTIPNLLSLFRLMLIPLIVWLYCLKHEYYYATAVLLLSGVTDIVDGYIARKFNMVSDIGKVLDPIADKLTQANVLICLGIRYPILLLLVVIMTVKEAVSGLMSLSAIRKTKEIKGADWHGKATTCLIYFTILLHLLWIDIPYSVTVTATVLCSAFMVLSFTLYFHRNVIMIKRGKQSDERDIQQ